MAVGIAVTKDQIDAMAGGIARDIHRNILRGLDMFQAMQDLNDATLEGRVIRSRKLTRFAKLSVICKTCRKYIVVRWH